MLCHRYLDKMKMDKTKISPSSVISGTSVISMQQINNLLKSSGSSGGAPGSGGINKNTSPSSQHDFNLSSSHRSPSLREV